MRELPAGTAPAAVEAELAAIDPGTVAFALWRGGERPAADRAGADASTVMMAMPGAPKALRAIDAAVLEALVLAPLLGLDADQFLTTDQVRYVRGLTTPRPWSIRARPIERLPAARAHRRAGRRRWPAAGA